MVDHEQEHGQGQEHGHEHGAGRHDVDGRVRRRIDNRAAALAALISLFERGHGHPTVEEVAAEAGLSPRSVFRYFDDRESLLRAGFHEVVGRAAVHLDFAGLGEGSFENRVERFIERRLVLFREFGALATTAAVAMHDDPVLEEHYEVGRMLLRRQFVDHFDQELSMLPPAERTRATTLATLPLQFPAFQHLHESLGDDVEEIRRLLVDQLTANLNRFRRQAVD